MGSIGNPAGFDFACNSEKDLFSSRPGGYTSSPALFSCRVSFPFFNPFGSWGEPSESVKPTAYFFRKTNAVNVRICLFFR
jgi:hypothetical protein